MKKMIYFVAAFVALTVSGAANAEYEGLYWGAFGGANWVNVNKHNNHHSSSSSSSSSSTTNQFRFKKPKFDTGWLLGAQLGYQWCGGFSVEAEFAYRYNKLDKWRRHNEFSSSSSSSTEESSSSSSSSTFANSSSHHHDRSNGHLRTWSIMANGLYQFEVDCWCIQPYVGVGLGYANSKLKLKHHEGSSSSEIVEEISSSSSSNNNGDRFSEDRKGFAWQIIAGIAYPVCDCWDLTLEYRYFQARNNIRNNSLDVGIKYAF